MIVGEDVAFQGDVVEDCTAFDAGDKISTAADGKAAKTGSGPVIAVALSKGAAGKPATVALL